jgi:hypothetical protein
MSDKKPLSVTLEPEVAEQLRDITKARKANKNLAWSQPNILKELIAKQHKKECTQ